MLFQGCWILHLWGSIQIRDRVPIASRVNDVTQSCAALRCGSVRWEGMERWGGLLGGRDAEHCSRKTKEELAVQPRRKVSFLQKKDRDIVFLFVIYLGGIKLCVFLHKSILSSLYYRATHRA